MKRKRIFTLRIQIRNIEYGIDWYDGGQENARRYLERMIENSEGPDWRERDSK